MFKGHSIVKTNSIINSRDIMLKPNDTIICWFSCGAASAVAAIKTKELYSDTCKIRIANNPILEEHEDNQRFLKDVESYIGIKIETVVSKKYPNSSAKEVWQARKFMSSPLGAPCTLELKKFARRDFEEENKIDWHVLGFTSEERERADRFKLTERSNLLTPLIDLNLNKQDCLNYLLNIGITPPKVYQMGYPNANCIGCVKATSPSYWNHVRKVHPEVFEDRAKLSRELGVKLTRVKNKRIFLDELPEDAKGWPVRSLNFECGIFCEETRKK